MRNLFVKFKSKEKKNRAKFNLESKSIGIASEAKFFYFKKIAKR